ncbi:hypothetical protein SFRURICE_011762 [Spodoptera frugiperda]|nr:hypothetical protein SFRURICE_011762 [Spodoptera frugiperda]
MKFVLVLCLVAAAVVADDEKYTSKYDNIDLDEILSNKRLLTAYVNCIMERGKCSPEGKELKEHLVDAIETGCKKCTEAQEKGAYKVIEHLIQHELDTWRELCDKYDASGKWRKTYEDRAKANGICPAILLDRILLSSVRINKPTISMNFLVLSIVVTMAAFVAAETYTDRYDHINIDEIIENRKLLDAMQTSCSKCTDKQKKGARKVVRHIRAKEQDYWKQILAKYDPEDQYRENYESFLAAED